MCVCVYHLLRYLVTHLMGADLNNILKTQKLSDDHVQFLIYQILRGLKVRFCCCLNVIKHALINITVHIKILKI